MLGLRPSMTMRAEKLPAQRLLCAFGDLLRRQVGNMRRHAPADAIRVEQFAETVAPEGIHCRHDDARAFLLVRGHHRIRSEARRVGKECVSKGRIRWSTYT